jgi:hypothetical protein
MSPLLQQVLEGIDQLTSDEQLTVISHTTEHLKQQTGPLRSELIPKSLTPKSLTLKSKWLDIAGTAAYPLVGEDAQEWVTRNRQEGQEYRDRLLGRESEN